MVDLSIDHFQWLIPAFKWKNFALETCPYVQHSYILRNRLLFSLSNNLNQTNNVMLWWTEAVGSITFCWWGRFYNRGEGLQYCAPITCHQSRRDTYLEIPLSSDSSMLWRPRWLFCFNCFSLLWLHVSCLVELLLSKGSLFFGDTLRPAGLFGPEGCLHDRQVDVGWVNYLCR